MLSGDGGAPFGFTGEYRDEASGLVFLRARYLQVADGRFISRDMWPGDEMQPVTFNAWVYSYSNPLRWVDPSGYAPQGPNDDPNNPAPCSTDWCWKNRWYRAHGYSWTRGGWSLTGADAVFYDRDILDKTMGELGITFSQELVSPWSDDEAALVGQGVVALANKIGSFRQLRSLLGFGILPVDFHRSPAWIAPAGTIPCTTVVVWANGAFPSWSQDYTRGLAVHELAHVIDYFGGVGGVDKAVNVGGGQWQRGYMVPKDAYVSWYGRQNKFGLEYWAEAVTDWVYGARYYGPYAPGVREQLKAPQSDWIERVLKGWGW